jgi:hypothetical protein
MLAEIGFEQPGAYLGSLVRSTVDEALRTAGMSPPLDLSELSGPDLDLGPGPGGNA